MREETDGSTRQERRLREVRWHGKEDDMSSRGLEIGEDINHELKLQTRCNLKIENLPDASRPGFHRVACGTSFPHGVFPWFHTPPDLRVSTNLVITTLVVEVYSDHCNYCFDVAAVAKSTNGGCYYGEYELYLQ